MLRDSGLCFPPGPGLRINMEGVVHHAIRYGPSWVGLALKISRFLIRVVLFIHKRKIISGGGRVSVKTQTADIHKKRFSSHMFSIAAQGHK